MSRNKKKRHPPSLLPQVELPLEDWTCPACAHICIGGQAHRKYAVSAVSCPMSIAIYSRVWPPGLVLSSVATKFMAGVSAI
jgi:hypothetical protein